MTPVSSLSVRASAAALGPVAVLVLVLGLLVGCGGSDGGGEEDDEPTTGASATEETSAEQAPTGYLPVPDGVRLTEPGTMRGLGAEATVAWRPRQDTVVALDLTVSEINQTSYEESFEGWVISRQMKGQVPYFVHAKATNVGATDVSTLLVPLYGLSSSTSMYEPLDFRREVFEPCPGGYLPDRLRPGKSADLCFVYLLPVDQQLDAAAFDLVGELAPITWTGEITPIEKPDKKKDKKKDKKDKKKDGPDQQGQQDG